MKVLYEILVPTLYGDNQRPIRTRHHKEWDKFVQKITGGLTILSSAKGKWTHQGTEYPERVIPVRVMCDERFYPVPDTECLEQYRDTSQINKIIHFTMTHYRQKAVMYYVVSNDVQIVYAQEYVGA
jgi:hypothetical protein